MTEEEKIEDPPQNPTESSSESVNEEGKGMKKNSIEEAKEENDSSSTTGVINTTMPQIAPLAKYKLVFLGDQGVGKTSMITRFMYDRCLLQPTCAFEARLLRIYHLNCVKEASNEGGGS